MLPTSGIAIIHLLGPTKMWIINPSQRIFILLRRDLEYSLFSSGFRLFPAKFLKSQSVSYDLFKTVTHYSLCD